MKTDSPVIIGIFVIFILLYIDFFCDFLEYKWKSYLFNVELIMMIIYFIPTLKKIVKSIST